VLRAAALTSDRQTPEDTSTVSFPTVPDIIGHDVDALRSRP